LRLNARLQPVFEIDGVSYIYLMHHSLYVVAVTNINADASLILMFLHELLKVFTGYFGKLEEENIRDNFVVIHELLDEMLDFGYPQVTNVSARDVCVVCLILFLAPRRSFCKSSSRRSTTRPTWPRRALRRKSQKTRGGRRALCIRRTRRSWTWWKR
jgi:hypothetical protein